MKKQIFALALLVVGTAQAADFSASVVPYIKSKDNNPSLKVYTRYNLDVDHTLFKFGNAKVDVSATGVFQNTQNGEDGFGAVADARLTVPVFKTTNLVAKAERFHGDIYNVKTRYTLGVDQQLFKLGEMKVSTTLAAVSQNTKSGKEETGPKVILKASMPVTKSVDLTGRVERFAGYETVSSLSLAFKF